MVLHFLEFAALALLLAFAGLVGFVRTLLRPRRARLDRALAKLPVEEVTIRSRSGATLAGWFAAGEGAGGVLLLHGAKSNRLAHVERMRMLADVGYATLAIDFQAHGESTGDCITLGQREALDARSALAWMRARMPGERLAVLGVSMGGAAALVGDEPIGADAVIVESVGADLAAAVSNRLALTIGAGARALTPVVLLALRAAGGIRPQSLRPIDGIGRLRAPVMVLAGADDRKAASEDSRAMFARANPPKFYWEAPGAGHVDLAYAGGVAYRERLLAFLASRLRAGADPDAVSR